MTIYATGNALGSTDVRDLLDNAQNFDNAVNDTASDTWVDRFGVTRKTLKGYDSDFEEDQAIRAAAFQEFLESTGWSSLGAYGAGVVITSHTQTVDYMGQPYSLKPSVPASLDAPYVTTGVWATEGINFKLVGDNSLRQDLANPEIGPGLLKYRARDIGERLSDSLNVMDYGADPDAADNRAAIHLAIADALALNRPLSGSGLRFDVLNPVYLGSLLELSDIHIRNTSSDAVTQKRLCVYPGTYNPVYLSSLTYHALSTVGGGARSVSCVTVAQSALYAAGDIVLIRTGSKYNGATGPIPTYASLNEVLSVNPATGVIQLAYPVGYSFADGQIAHVNGTGIMDILGEREIFCIKNLTLRNVVLESVNGHAMERGGVLGSSLHFKRISSLSGVYSNLINHSYVSVDQIQCDLRAIEVGGNCAHTIFKVPNIGYQKTSRSTAQALISINENQVDCEFDIGLFGAGAHDYAAQPLIHIQSGRDNTLAIRDLQANNAAGSIVTFENPLKSADGETQPETSGNTVDIGHASSAGALQRNVFYVNAGLKNKGNTLKGTFNTLPTVSAVSLAGDNQAIDAEFSSGIVSLGAATNSRVSYVGPGATVGLVRTSGNTMRVNGVNPINSPVIQGHKVRSNPTINGAGGAAAIAPDISLGSYQVYSFTSATSFSISNPIGGVGGDTFVMQIENMNGSTAITPTFGSAFAFGGEVPPALPAGKKAIYEFIVSTDFAYVLRKGITNNF